MQLYIEQLLEDIEQAKNNTPPVDEMDRDLDPKYDEIDIEDLNYVEHYIYGELKKMENILGIKKELLPPAHKLTDSQTETLVIAIESLWNAFHFTPDFPEGVPARQKYELLREYWEYETTSVSCGMIHIEFCDYDSEHCPFEGYCNTCEEVKKEWIEGHNTDENDEDFFSGLLDCYKDKDKLKLIQKLNKQDKDFIYQRFTFDNKIKDIFYTGDGFVSYSDDMEAGELLELAKDMAEEKEAFMPRLVSKIESLIGKKNYKYDFWEFGPDCFSLFWWIKRDVYPEKMKLIHEWLRYEEIEHLVEFDEELKTI